MNLWCFLFGHDFKFTRIESENIISENCTRCGLYRAKYVFSDGRQMVIVKNDYLSER